jgi:hypothetical protein
MSVKSSICSSNLGAHLNIGLFNWLRHNLILRSDYGDFYSIRFSLDWDRFFHIIVSFLLTVKAGNFVICHSVSLLCPCWHCLHKANHCLITLRIEFAIITSFNVSKLTSSVLLGILRDGSFDVILEISKESQTVFKFYCEGLVINWGPRSCQMLCCARNSIFAKDCFYLGFVHELNFPDIFLCKWELLILSNNLELVRQFMGTNFVNFEKINFILLFTDMECPYSVHLTSQAMNRLISHYS